MIRMTLSEAAAILSGHRRGADGQFLGVSTNTRTLEANTLFIALIGEQFDGHGFIQEAVAKGAAGVIVDRDIDINIPTIKVSDTQKALTALAAHWRNQFKIPVMGVTGSNGKTTLKNMLGAICQEAFHQKALVTSGNFNNEIGLPLMLLQLSSTHRCAVLEMGMNHPGEMSRLSRLAKPTVAIINNIAAAHLAGFNHIDDIAAAKSEIFEGLNEQGIVILNKDDTYFNYCRALSKDKRCISFGTQKNADVTGNIAASPFEIHTPQGSITVELSLLGEHNRMNALAATAGALALNIDLSSIKKGLEKVAPAPGRLNQHVLKNKKNKILLIDDTYNANPMSFKAAIHTLMVCEGDKILVMGDMRELGPEEKRRHFEVGKYANQAGVKKLLGVGELTKEAVKGFGEGALHFASHEELLQALKQMMINHMTILVKGSRGMRMERITQGLLQESADVH